MKLFLKDKKAKVKNKFKRAHHHWKSTFTSLYLREAAVIILLFLIIVISSSIILFRYFKNHINIYPKDGGTYTEGIVGQPQNLNPLYSQSSSIDRSIVSLVYSGLVKIDEYGNIAPDLAEKWESSEDNSKYTFYLRKDARWHDGDKVLSEDILFTYSVLQDPDYSGPLKNQFKDIVLETPNEFTVIFNNPTKDKSFINKLNVGILPQHMWSNYQVSDMPYLEQNLTPVGSGRFSFKNATSDGSGKIINLTLDKNSNFYGDKSFIESIIFKFYNNENEIKNALAEKEIDGSADMDSDSLKEVEQINRFRIYSYKEPGYKALFFNPEKNQLLSRKEIRKVFDLAIDRSRIENETLYKKALAISTAFDNYDKKTDIGLQRENAKKQLVVLGATDKDNNGFLEINSELLKFNLTINSDSESKKVARNIKEDLAKIGIEIIIEEKGSTEFERDILNPRNYQIVLLGQNYGKNKNLYSFWHSSQLKSPGLNFSQISSKRIDALLENYLTNQDEKEKDKILSAISKVIVDESYAVFLYKPLYVYTTDKRIKGLSKNYFIYPENRFIGIEKWYINNTWSFKI